VFLLPDRHLRLPVRPGLRAPLLFAPGILRLLRVHLAFNLREGPRHHVLAMTLAVEINRV
jgi:hypothetical protein